MCDWSPRQLSGPTPWPWGYSGPLTKRGNSITKGLYRQLDPRGRGSSELASWGGAVTSLASTLLSEGLRLREGKWFAKKVDLSDGAGEAQDWRGPPLSGKRLPCASAGRRAISHCAHDLQSTVLLEKRMETKAPEPSDSRPGGCFRR